MAKGVKGSTPPKDEQPVKTSLTILPTTMEKIRHVAFHEKKQIGVLVDEGLQHVISVFENKNGPIPVK